MTICNACRYCEGYCAVFPAMELRRTFTDGDLTYLANLCFDCRACLYACQYAPPHPFAVNVPRAFAELRTDTYRQFSWPALFGALLDRNLQAVLALTGAAVVVVLMAIALIGDPARSDAAPHRTRRLLHDRAVCRDRGRRVGAGALGTGGIRGRRPTLLAPDGRRCW